MEHHLKTPKGNIAKDQLVKTKKSGKECFYSYGTLIGVMIKFGKNTGVYLDDYYHNYSKTTSQYRNKWLGFANSNKFESALYSNETDIQLVSEDVLFYLSELAE